VNSESVTPKIKRRGKGCLGFLFLFTILHSPFTPCLSEEYAALPAAHWLSSKPDPAAPSAFVLEKTGRLTEALDSYLKTLKDNPSDARAKEGVGRVGARIHEQARDGREKDRRVYVEEALRRLENYYRRQKELDNKAREAKRLMKKNKALEASFLSGSVLEERPDLYSARRQVHKAQDLFAKMLRKGKFASFQAYSATVGMYFYNLGDWERAVENLETALEGPLPDSLSGARLGEYAATARARRDAERWRARRHELMTQGLAAEKAGRLEEAIGFYHSILEKDPNDAEARARAETLGAEWAALRDEVIARTRAREVFERTNSGLSHRQAGRYTEALEEFARALELEPDNKEVGAFVVETKEIIKQQGQFVPPVTVMDAAEKKYREGLRLYGNEKYSEATDCFRHALALNPKHDESRRALELIANAPSPEPPR
jgi:tetratricopeptide (TPR) repeat protein